MKPIQSAVAIAGVLLLSGCGVLQLTPTATPTAAPTREPASPSPTPTPTPTREPAPDFAGEVLFTIAAKITAADGATANLKQTVYVPVDDLGRLDIAEDRLDDECGADADTYLVAELTATDSSPAGGWDAEPQFLVTHAETAVFFGDAVPAHGFCTNAEGYVPGAALAVAVLSDGTPADAPGGWATLPYGLRVLDDATTLSQCRITVSDAAKQLSSTVSAWAGIRQDPGTCEVNTLGL